MYNKLNLLPFAKLSEAEISHLKELEKKLTTDNAHPVFLMALCPPEVKN